jgi:hypothetical protein
MSEIGKCRVCGCTELAPCKLIDRKTGGIYPCAWVDVEKTLCVNPRCVAETPIPELLTMDLNPEVFT